MTFTFTHQTQIFTMQHDSKYADAEIDAGWSALSARRASEFELLFRMQAMDAHADALRVLVDAFQRYALQWCF